MNAFEKWFQNNFRDHVNAGAQYLYECCVSAPKDSIAWDWLKKTGDKQYTRETFIKAAKLIIGDHRKIKFDENGKLVPWWRG